MSGTDRRWLELRARCPDVDDGPARLVEGLLSLGGRAAEERDGWLLTHVEAPADLEAFMEEARDALEAAAGSETVELEACWRAHEDWSETWKRGLAPRRITDRILVHPSWLPAPSDEAEATIVLDPGMAFGTAEHGTTRGCLRLLDRVVSTGDAVLDIGAGSGILAIAVVLLGASSCQAVEADPLSCEALRENVARNGVGSRVRCVEAEVDAAALGRLGPVEGVVANIETGLLEALMPGFASAVEPGGWLVVSGILAHEWPSLRAEAEDAGFRYEEVDRDGAWRSGLFTRPLGVRPPRARPVPPGRSRTIG